METIKHSTGREVTVQYFGDLEEKIQVALGYVYAYNDFASKTHSPQIDADQVVNNICKQHAKFYGMDNKYKGDGSLRGVGNEDSHV